MSVDPILGVDSRLVDERYELFKFLEKASMDCFLVRGAKANYAEVKSWAGLKEMDQQLQEVMKQCRSDVWNEMKQSVGPEVIEMNSCFEKCLKQGSTLVPDFIKAPNCRLGCYQPYQTKFSQYVKQPNKNLPQ